MTKPGNKNTRLVYSSETGQKCGKCGKPLDDCRCGQKPAEPGDGIVRVRRETKGRKGKGVSLVTGVPLQGEALKQLAKQLRRDHEVLERECTDLEAKVERLQRKHDSLKLQVQEECGVLV